MHIILHFKKWFSFLLCWSWHWPTIEAAAVADLSSLMFMEHKCCVVTFNCHSEKIKRICSGFLCSVLNRGCCETRLGGTWFTILVRFSSNSTFRGRWVKAGHRAWRCSGWVTQRNTQQVHNLSITNLLTTNRRSGHWSASIWWMWSPSYGSYVALYPNFSIK